MIKPSGEINPSRKKMPKTSGKTFEKKSFESVRLRMSGYDGFETKRYSTRPATTAPVRLENDLSIPQHAPRPVRPRAQASAPARKDAPLLSDICPDVGDPRLLKVGDACWALDAQQLWGEARVIQLGLGRVKVHYNGFAKKFDEWKDLHSPAIRLTAPILAAKAAKRGREARVGVPSGKRQGPKAVDRPTFDQHGGDYSAEASYGGSSGFHTQSLEEPEVP